MEQQPQRVVVTLTLETTVELDTLSSQAFWQNRFIGPSVAVVDVAVRAERGNDPPGGARERVRRKKSG